MEREFTGLPPELRPMQPGMEILRLAALLAERETLDEDDIDFGLEDMEIAALDLVQPSEIWPELERGLMGRMPSAMVRALQRCGALQIILPEIAAVFGVPQIADSASEVDIGAHLLRALDEAAHCNAPLEVRYALFTMNVGKSDSPREHLPVHYKHIDRGAPRIKAISARFGVPPPCRDLALLALAECERIHRVSAVRAGPVAALLDRVGAFTNPTRFGLLMMVTSCDYRAYGGQSEDEAYPKAELIDTALKVCAELDADDFEGAAADDVLEARALAIAQAFRSQRWSSE